MPPDDLQTPPGLDTRPTPWWEVLMHAVPAALGSFASGSLGQSPAPFLQPFAEWIRGERIRRERAQGLGALLDQYPQLKQFAPLLVENEQLVAPFLQLAFADAQKVPLHTRPNWHLAAGYPEPVAPPLADVRSLPPGAFPEGLPQPGKRSTVAPPPTMEEQARYAEYQQAGRRRVFPDEADASIAQARLAAAQHVADQQARTEQQRLRHIERMEELGVRTTEPPRTTAAQQSKTNALFPGERYGALTPDKKVQVDKALETDKRTAFKTRLQDTLDQRAQLREQQAQQDTRTARIAFEQIKAMAEQVLTVEGPPHEASFVQKWESVWNRVKQAAGLQANAVWQGDEGSIVAAYNRGIGLHVLNMVRALARTGRITNQEMVYIAESLPTTSGKWWLPDTKQTMRLKLANLGQLLNQYAARPTDSVSPPWEPTSMDPKSAHTIQPPYYGPVSAGEAGQIGKGLEGEWGILEEYAPTQPGQ